MLTALNITTPYSKSKFNKFLGIFRHNKIKVEHLYCDSAALKNITYIQNKKRINWNTIDKFVKSQRNHLLCSEELCLPKEIGYKRFVSNELNERMCTNAAIYLLEKLNNTNVKVAVIDKSSAYIELANYLIDFTDTLYIYTESVENYLSEADHILYEKGAAIHITRDEKAITDFDLYIAPECLQKKINCSENALILSAQEPKVSQKAKTVYKYFFDLPPKYDLIKPKYLDDMYFAGALYSMCRAYELGSYTFKFCTSDESVHTRASLLNILQERLTQKDSVCEEN